MNSYNKEKKDWIAEILDECIECGACTEECILLQEIGEEPASIADRGVELGEAFNCSLCYMCQAVCPLELNPGKMFAQKRIEAVSSGEIDIDQYRYLFPDRELNIMKFFRQYYGIDYADLKVDTAAEVGFFPGCTMMTYSPELTHRVYNKLQAGMEGITLLSDCCGKPLYQLGLESRGDRNRQLLTDKIKELGIKKLIVACPNCYYELKEIFNGQNVEIITVYEVLPESEHTRSGVCTVHDSCPDRFDNIFGNQVRDALHQMGFQIREMEHSRDKTICCGSGGQISNFRPEFAIEMVEQRMSEAEATGSDILIGYCHSCVLNFARDESGIPVRHALNLILGFDQDYTGVKNKAGAMFEGLDGEENWEKIMAD